LAATTLTSGLIRPAFRIDRSQINVRFGVECALAIALPRAYRRRAWRLRHPGSRPERRPFS
jgi:hypothetical protein